jgi:hypothetical protein
MANLSFNVALGRECEFHWRVDNNDPANSALIVLVLASSGLEADAVLRTYDTLDVLLAASNNEVTNNNYARKTLTDANISPFTVSDTLNTITLPLANQTFSTIGAGDSWAKLLICYDSDTTGGGDASIIPVKMYDVQNPVTGAAVVPTGNNIIFGFSLGYHIAA